MDPEERFFSSKQEKNNQTKPTNFNFSALKFCLLIQSISSNNPPECPLLFSMIPFNHSKQNLRKNNNKAPQKISYHCALQTGVGRINADQFMVLEFLCL